MPVTTLSALSDSSEDGLLRAYIGVRVGCNATRWEIAAARRPEIAAASGEALEEPHHVAILLAEGICYLKPLIPSGILDHTLLRNDLTPRLLPAFNLLRQLPAEARPLRELST